MWILGDLINCKTCVSEKVRISLTLLFVVYSADR